MTKHKHYDAAYRAHLGTSFSPEKRADGMCAYYDEIVAEFTAAGKESAIAKFERLFLKWMAAKGRMISPMIAGPARFPVARMQKYGQWERNAGQAVFDYVDKVRRPPRQPRKELDYNISAKDYMRGSVRVIHNTEANRIQLIFDGKPADATRALLKKCAYKWSPRAGAWQRQLTPNALYNLKYLLDKLDELGATTEV